MARMKFDQFIFGLLITYGLLIAAKMIGLLALLTQFIGGKLGFLGLGSEAAMLYLAIVAVAAAIGGSFIGMNMKGKDIWVNVLLIAGIIVALAIWNPTWLPAELQLLAAKAQAVFGIAPNMSVIMMP